VCDALGGTNTLRTARVAPLDFQKCLSAMLLEASSCLLPCGAVHVGVDGMICHRLAFFFLLSPISKIIAWSFLILIIILLIVFLNPFVQLKFFFQFHPSIFD
jgi:hypothetical protein